MKNLFTTLISCVAVACLMAPVAFAQTPDGQTPAEETVCNPLKADGITKGLYGLCVAFCEAHDHADADASITEDDLALLEAEAPSGRILANYDKKKTETDPAMPCILVEEPCPCWSAAELASIGDPGGTVCSQQVNQTTGLIDIRRITDGNVVPGTLHFATAWDTHRDDLTVGLCRYQDDSAPIVRLLTTTAGTLTHGQAVVCLEQVNTRCAETGH